MQFFTLFNPYQTSDVINLSIELKRGGDSQAQRPSKSISLFKAQLISKRLIFTSSDFNVHQSAHRQWIIKASSPQSSFPTFWGMKIEINIEIPDHTVIVSSSVVLLKLDHLARSTFDYDLTFGSKVVVFTLSTRDQYNLF